MFETDSTTAPRTNNELNYYEQLEKHINSLSKKFRDKSVTKQHGLIYCST